LGQEGLRGVRQVAGTAAPILVADRSPQGAEQVKKMMVGGILSVTPDEIVKFMILYGAIDAFHWLVRRPLLAAADDTNAGSGRVAVWDLIFYLSFGLVVTSSVGTAGVLLVFCFFIVPALVRSLFSSRIGVALVIGWIAGAAASAVGIFGSFLVDAPTGAVTVVAFAAVLLAAGAPGALRLPPPRARPPPSAAR